METGAGLLAEPHNAEVEAALLGAILVNNHAYDRVADVLLPEHFYEPVHGRIYAAIAQRIEKDQKVTPSVLMEFADDPGLADHGGQQYLYEIVAGVISTTPAAVRNYGEIVRDLYLRRQLIMDCRNAIAAASEHDGTTTAREIIEAHEETLYGVTRTRVETRMVTAAGAFDELLLRTDAAMKRDTRVIGVPTGLAGIDNALGGLQDSKLIVVGSRPSMGKTALACNILWNAANDGYSCVMFSQEMSDYQIASRWAARETGLAVSEIGNGNITVEQFGRINQVRSDIAANIRLHVDDSGKISVAQIRSRVRRLLRKGLDLVVIDYLGLIEPTQNARRNNRTEQVSEITRELKQMTQDFDIPILLLSQLSRELERRDNKRPLLSDLRESGCITGDTLVADPLSGQRRRIDSMIGDNPGLIVAAKPGLTTLVASASRGFSTGIKPVFKITLKTGRAIEATANHKFLTQTGWRRLDTLSIEDYLATPRETFAMSPAPSLSMDELLLLGHMIGDGCALPRHALQYTCGELELAELVAGAASRIFGDAIKPRISKERTWYQVYLPAATPLTHGKRNPVGEWLDGLGLWGKRGHEKHVPDCVFSQYNRHIGFFLSHLWATDGHVGFRHGKKPQPAIFYSTASERLARDVQSLLLRLGIVATLRCIRQRVGCRDNWTVNISGQADTRKFLDLVGVLGEHRTKAKLAIEQYLATTQVNVNRDIVPYQLWESVALEDIAHSGLTAKQIGERMGQSFRIGMWHRGNFSRARLRALARAISSDRLFAFGNSDVYWDRIRSIEPVGEAEVFDITVPHHHNFLANDIILHNSIEQDADVVMFLYRDEYYLEKSEPVQGAREKPVDYDERRATWTANLENAAGVCEAIIAKNRQGPTKTVHLHFDAATNTMLDHVPHDAADPREQELEL